MYHERKLSTNETIHVFDEVFEAFDAFNFELYVRDSYYVRIPISKSSLSKNETFFGSILSEADVEKHGLFKTSGFEKIKNFFTDKKIQRSWILVGEFGTKSLYHADYDRRGVTLLYYVNTFWHPEWGGETLFCNGFGEPEIAIACKPNRVVIFPSNILHKPSGITRDAITRYSLTTTFVNE